MAHAAWSDARERVERRLLSGRLGYGRRREAYQIRAARAGRLLDALVEGDAADDREQFLRNLLFHGYGNND